MIILEVKNVEKSLSKKKVLKWISFSVKTGEIYWYLWPNWAGKTTTMKTILGLIEQEKWKIKVFWENWLTIEAKQKIWFMPENTYLYKHLTGREFLEFNWKIFWLKWEKLEKKIQKLLKRVWLENSWNRYLKDYSKWMLQRIWLAQSIINNPQLLFLDEPMSGLDPIWRKMVKDLIVSLKKEWTTIFFNTHILADVESICDRISIINEWDIIVEWQKVAEIKWGLENFFIEKIEKINKKK